MEWPDKWLDPLTGRVAHVPMEWCAMAGRPALIDGARWDGVVDRHGTPLTLATVVDGREVPFKLLRGPGGDANGGHRPTMVALHGMGLTPATFQPILPAILATHDVVVVDYNSFGGRGWPGGGVSLRMMAAAVWRVVDALGIGRVSMIGSSLGGGLAIIGTSMFPERVEELILLNPAAYPQPLPKMYRIARIPMIGELMMHISRPQKFIDGVAYIGYSAPEKMPMDVRRAYERNLEPVENRLKLMDVMRALPANGRDMQDPQRRFRGLGHRALIVWGMLEKLLPADAGRRLAEDLPNSELIEYGDLAHLPHEEDPGRISRDIRRFLRGARELSSPQTALARSVAGV